MEWPYGWKDANIIKFLDSNIKLLAYKNNLANIDELEDSFEEYFNKIISLHSFLNIETNIPDLESLPIPDQSVFGPAVWANEMLNNEFLSSYLSGRYSLIEPIEQ